MKSYSGIYQAAHQSVDATVLVFDKIINVGYVSTEGRPVTIEWLIRDLLVDFSMASNSTRIRNLKESGIEVIIAGREVDQVLKEQVAKLGLPWHQTEKAKEWLRNTGIFFAITGLLIALYFTLVPWMASLVASNVSVKTEEQFGEAVYNGLQIGSTEDTAASATINHFFDAMKVPAAYNIRITVAKGETVNAFALPGGRIVVYTALIERMESYPELAALLSHEFIHVNNKHSTKSIFRRLGSKVFIGLLFGKFGNVTAVLADQADNLKSLTYSRHLETEADREGLELLKQRHIDPRGFEDLFLHLQESAPASALPEILSSHPDIDKRIAAIKEHTGAGAATGDVQLKSIFEKLKQQIQ